MRRIAFGVLVVSLLTAGTIVISSGGPVPAYGQTSTPITHIVVFYQENHSFDNVLGAYCVSRPTPCDGATIGEYLQTNGTDRQVTLRAASDVVPNVNHFVQDQITAIDGGKMDGFSE